MRKIPRSAAVVACALCAAFAGACGGDDDDDGSSTTTTSVVTVTVALSTTTVPPAQATAAATTPETTAPAAAPGTYIVVAGDSLFRIAERHCVTLDELVAANGWPEGIDHVILPDDTVQLPANACAPGESTTTTSPASTEPTTATTG